MNELNKLIQQYERDNPGKKAKISLGLDYYQWSDGFVNWLVESFINSFQHMDSQIKSLESRPTCGKEQRLFLDVIEKDGVIEDGNLGQTMYIGETSMSEISSNDFNPISLEKVITGE